MRSGKLVPPSGWVGVGGIGFFFSGVGPLGAGLGVPPVGVLHAVRGRAALAAHRVVVALRGTLN